MRADSLGRFVFRVVLWLPFAFFAWYQLMPVFNWPLSGVMQWIMGGLVEQLVTEIRLNGAELEVVLGQGVAAAQGSTGYGTLGELVITVDPLSYSFGIPLFTALLIASPGQERVQWLRWLAGLAILLLVQVWGVCFDILKTVLFHLPRELSAGLELARWQLNGVALGYQLGFLILPAVVPLILWIAFYSGYIIRLMPSIAGLLRR